MDFNSEQESLIQKDMEQLCGADDAALAALNADSVSRRVAWFRENKDRLSFLSEDLLDNAYRLLLTRFGISPEEAPIVSRTESQITFHSQNFCPTLEACKRLGLDTRHICHCINEDSTNQLIRQIDPRLTFSRNYEKLRPYSPYCEEMISLNQQ